MLALMSAGILCSSAPALAQLGQPDSRLNAPVTSEAYPNADSVLMLDDIKLDVNPDHSYAFDEHDAVKILTKDGIDDNATLLRVVDTSNSSVKVLMARTIKADGRVLQAEPAQLSPLAPDSKTYGNVKRFTIRFPDVEVGDTVEFHIRTTHKPRYGGNFWATTYVQNPMPIMDSTFTVTVPKDIKFRTATPGHPGFKPEESSLEEGGVTYRRLKWDIKNESAYEYETMAPKTVTLLKRIEVSSFDNWDQVADFVQKEWNEQDKIPEGLALRVAGWMPTTGDLASRAESVVKELNGKRQVAGYLADEPDFHYPEDLFPEKLVSSPDAVLLTSVALKAAGIPNFPVLTFGVNSKSMENELPTPEKINKMVLEIPRAGESSLWFDPETPAFVSDIMPANTSDTAAISWDPRFGQGKKGMVDLQLGSAFDNREEVAMEGRLERTGTAELTLQYDRYGALAFDSRQAARDIQQGPREARDRALQNFFRNTTRAYGPRARLLERYFELDADSADPFSLSFTVAVPGYAQVQDRTMMVPLPRFLPSALRAAAREHNRTTPLVFDQPYQQDVRIHLIFPEGSQVKDVPMTIDKKTPEAEFQATGRAEGNQVWYVGRLTVFDPWTESDALARSLQTLEAALHSEDTILKVELPPASAAAEEAPEEDDS